MSDLYCEMCGLKPATIHFSQTVNGVTSEKHLCTDCGKKMQIINLEGFMNPANIIASAVQNAKPRKQRVCRCGTTESDLMRDFKLGCSECYEVFSDLIQRFLGGSPIAHKGKIYTGKGTGVKREKRFDKVAPASEADLLRARLREAVEKEDYDEAAVLSKQIKALEAKEGKGE